MVVYKGPSFSSVQQAAAVAPTLGQEQQDDVGIVEHANALEAHFAEDNWVSKGIENVYLLGEKIGEQTAMLMTGQRYDAEFNPYDYITEPKYADYADRFFDCKSKQQVDLMKMRINNELQHREDMSKVGVVANLAYGFLANAADPTNFMPFGKLATVVKGKGFVAGATKGALTGGTSNLVQELFLKEMSVTYTDDEFQQNLLLGTAIAGGLGGIIGKFGKQAALDTLDIHRKDIFDEKFNELKSAVVERYGKQGTLKNLSEDVDVVGVDDFAPKESIGAALAPAQKVKDDNVLAKGLIKAQAKFNPLLDAITSPNNENVRVGHRLSSSAVISDRVQSVDTIDAKKKVVGDKVNVANQVSKDNYLKYLYSKENIGVKDRVKRYLPVSMGGIDPKSMGKMTPQEWNEAVTDCVESGFKKHSDNPYLVETAKEHAKIQAENGEIIKRLNEEGKLSVGVVKNYMHRSFSVSKVAENANAFVDALVNRYRQLREFMTKGYPQQKIDLEQTRKNLETDEGFLKDRQAEIKVVNKNVYDTRRAIYKTEAELKSKNSELRRALKRNDKTNDKIWNISPDLDIHPSDREFSRHVARGIPQHLKVKSLSEYLKDAGILIDDVKGDLGKEYPFSLQNYKGRDIDVYNVMTPDEVGEYLWQEGWYRESPYVDEVLNDLFDDYNGYVKKYHENDYAKLRREHDVDEARETLRRLGYDPDRMSTEQVDNVLSNIGDKALIRNKIAKGKEQILSQISGKEKAEINEITSEIKKLEENLSILEENLSNYRAEQSSLRAARDKAKLDIREGKAKIRNLTDRVAKAEKLLNANDDDLREMAYKERERLNNGDSSVYSSDDVAETGRLLSRDLLSGDLPDDLARFLERDSSVILNNARKEYVDLMLIDEFGSVSLSEQKKRISDEWDRAEKQLNVMKNNGADPDVINKKLKKLQDRRSHDASNLDLLLGRIRETNYATKDISPKTETALSALKVYNVATSLSQILLSSIPDIGGVIAKTNLKHTVGSLKAVKNFASLSVQEQLKRAPYLAHAIVETFTNARGLSFAEFTNNSPFENRFMRITRGATDVTMRAFGATLWNKYAKILAGFSHISYLQEIADIYHKTGKISDIHKEYMGRYGLYPRDLREIYVNVNRYGSKSDDGINMPNFMTWKNQDLAMRLRYGVDKVMDEAIVTPGLDKAKVFDNPYLSVLFQFKSFSATAVGSTLIPGLQSADRGNVLAGMATMVGLGMLSVMAKNALAGREPLEPSEVFTRGFAASGVSGWIEEGYKLANMATMGGPDKLLYAVSGGVIGDDKYSGYQQEMELESFLGPSFGKIKNLFKITGDLSEGKIKRSTWRKLKQLVPFQNFYGINYAFNKMIDNLSDEE